MDNNQEKQENEELENPPPPPEDIPQIKTFAKGTIEVKENDLQNVKLREVGEDEKHYVSMGEMIEKLQGNFRVEKYGEKIGSFMNKKAQMKKKEIEGNWMTWHGALGKKEWKLPTCVAKTDKVSRRDQNNYTNASEYLDDEKVLDEKMKIVAELMKKSKFTTMYTGAGISRAGGIGDYGTQAEKSVMNEVKIIRNPAAAKPTFAHHAIANFERKKYVHYYIQQNHDGLPQKAGFPQEKMNEIHGAWFDISNPVVSFSGNLRSDLFKDMLKVEEKTQLCLCMGTSLSGMNSDRCVITPCEKFVRKEEDVLGSVIVNLQFTPVDMPGYVSIRIWAKIDDAMRLLAKHLDITVEKLKLPSCNAVFECPYDQYGRFDRNKKMIMNLAVGQKLKIVQPGAVNKGKEGPIVSRNVQGNFLVNISGGPTRLLGKWWLNTIKEGKLKQIPFVNSRPKFVVEKEEKDDDEDNWSDDEE